MTPSNPPVHTVNWYKDGKVLEVHPVLQSEELTVIKMAIEEFGSYNCEAETVLGVVSSNVITYTQTCGYNLSSSFLFRYSTLAVRGSSLDVTI